MQMQMLAQHSTAKAIVRREGGAVHLLERSSSGHASQQVRQMQCSAVLCICKQPRSASAISISTARRLEEGLALARGSTQYGRGLLLKGTCTGGSSFA